MTYTQPQKAVAALLGMGKLEAAELLARLSKGEREQLLANARQMRVVPNEDLVGIANEFELAFSHAAFIRDASNSFRQLVSDSLGADTEIEAEPASKEVSSTPIPLAAFEIANTDEIVEFLADEDEMVSACVLSRLEGDRVGEILQFLDEPRQAAIFKAMTTLGETSAVVLEAINHTAGTYFENKNAASNAGKLTDLARLLNSIDRETAESALRSLQDSFNAKDISALRSMLFRFEDVIKLEPDVRSTVFDVISADEITVALSDASEGLREAILSSISQRTRRIIENDLKTQKNISPPATRKAQKRVVSQILQMAAVGSLTLPNSEPEAA